MKKFLMILTFLLAVFTSSEVMGAACKGATAIFIFGDSLVDSGTNNYMKSNISPIAWADHPPYGIDYPNRVPTGRFTNNRHIPDMIADYCGIARALPFLHPQANGNNLLPGCNFASGGAAILDVLSKNLTPYTFTLQIQWFKNVRQRLIALEGSTAAALRFKNGIFYFTFGSNDLSQKPFSPYNSTSDAEFVTVLINKLKEHLIELYNLGARRMYVNGIGCVGCTPVARTLKCGFTYPCNRTCNEDANNLASAFNVEARKMCTSLNNTLPGSNIFFTSEPFTVTLDAINNGDKYGFIETKLGCCGTGYYEIGAGCIGNFVCPNRRDYLFFDATHPGDHMLQILAEKLYPYLS